MTRHLPTALRSSSRCGCRAADFFEWRDQLPLLATYHAPLVRCVALYLEADAPRFAAPAIAAVLGAWPDGGCVRRGPGGLRRGLLRRNNCRPAVELINFRAEARRWWTPAERRSMAPREASGERCTTPEKTLTFRTRRARACKRECRGINLLNSHTA